MYVRLKKGGFIHLLHILRHGFIHGSAVPKGCFTPMKILYYSIFLDICVGARILDSELLKCFCVMLASSYVMGTPDSATCSVLLPREAVV